MVKSSQIMEGVMRPFTLLMSLTLTILIQGVGYPQTSKIPIGEADLGAFFLMSSTPGDPVTYRVVGAMLVDSAPIILIEIDKDAAVDDDSLRRIQKQFMVPGSKVQLGIVQKLEMEPLVKAFLDVTVPVSAATAVTFQSEGKHGTIGCRLTNGYTFILSNTHVLADSGQQKIGASVYQGREPIGRLSAVECLSRFELNLVDAALACTTPSCVLSATPKKDFQFAGSFGKAKQGDKVAKLGFGSPAPRHGKVISTTGEFLIPMTNGERYCFSEQIVVESTENEKFGIGGDSGSVVVDEDFQPVGLYFGRFVYKENGKEWELYLANDIHHVVTKMNAGLSDKWRTNRGLSVDTSVDKKGEEACRASLKSCPASGENPCDARRKKDEAIKKAIEKQGLSESAYIECANTLLVKPEKGPYGFLSVPGKPAEHGLRTIALPSDVSMQEVLDLWRSRETPKQPRPTDSEEDGLTGPGAGIATPRRPTSP